MRDAGRLKKRDESKTKKMMGEKDLEDLEGILDGETRRMMTEEERQLMFEESRIVSRQAYLEKREDKKVACPPRT